MTGVTFNDARDRRAAVRAFVPLVLLVVAGCAAPSEPPAADDAASAGTPEPDPQRALAHLEALAKGYPRRHADFPAEHEAARTFLESALADAGVVAMRHEYSATGANVLGFLNGTTRPDEWIVLSCHFDTEQKTIEGARDDAVGCGALLAMAEAYAARPWDRTLVFAFFDEEESGLVGSRAFVESEIERAEATLYANLNFDPAGLHWPCGDAAGPYPVRLFITEEKLGVVPGYAELLEAVRNGFAAAAVPDELVEVATTYAYVRAGDATLLPPGSDDDSFDAKDIPSIWMGAPPRDEVGPIGAWSYPNHTPADTLEALYARCGDKATMGEGLRVAMVAATHALVEIDATAPAAG